MSTGRVAIDLFVHDALDVAPLVVGERLEVREVEAQPIRRDERAGLAHVRAQPLAQRGVQQVRGGVVAARRIASVGIDIGA